MACKDNGCLCNHFVISDSVTFADNTLLIDIPMGIYENGEKYCLVIGQDIPEDTTVSAQVAITIGGVTDPVYPLVNPNCTNVNASQIRSRARYATKVYTNISDGVFKLLSFINCNNNCCNTNSSLPITIPTITTEGGAG